MIDGVHSEVVESSIIEEYMDRSPDRLFDEIIDRSPILIRPHVDKSIHHITKINFFMWDELPERLDEISRHMKSRTDSANIVVRSIEDQMEYLDDILEFKRVFGTQVRIIMYNQGDIIDELSRYRCELREGCQIVRDLHIYLV